MNCYIDRDALLNNIKVVTAFSKEDGSVFYEAHDVRRAIEQSTRYSAPYVDEIKSLTDRVNELESENDALKRKLEKYKPNPHWEEKEYGVARCSECGWVRVDLRGHTYCPNCGVKMNCE